MMVVWEKLVNSVVVIVRLGCCLGLVFIYSAKWSYAADIFLQVESWVPGFYFGQRGGMRATNALLGRSVWKGG